MSQLSLFPENKKLNKEQITLDLFRAYYDARKNKRNTVNALAFEKYFEANIFDLCDEITEKRYKPKRSIAFIVNKPVKREIFAADFRDRVVHHLIFNYISPIFEKTFINDSYSCRVGKGTHYGIKRIDKFIRSCSENYQKDCYILKLDITGYFMAMNKNILFQKIKTELTKRKENINFNFNLVLYLIEQTIFNEPVKNCIIKGKKTDWQGLPKTKSLFHTKKNCGLPIGNLTSQLFGNIYMNEFDHFVKRDCCIKYYGRYVDDFVLIHNNKEHLKSLIPILSNFLLSVLKLTLHLKKIYLQHFSKGVKYLGTVIKSNRIYIANRTKGNFYEAIEDWNKIIRANKKLSRDELEQFISSINSYLGIMKHYKTYKIRKKMLKSLSAWIFNQVYISGGYCKLVAKTKYH
jgi:hypothetical protein